MVVIYSHKKLKSSHIIINLVLNGSSKKYQAAEKNEVTIQKKTAFLKRTQEELDS